MPGPVSVLMPPSAPFLPIRKFKPRLSKEQEAETISPCIASAMIQRPALAKLSGTEVARSSAIRVESLQQLPWDGLDLVLQTFLELHLTPTTLLRLFLSLAAVDLLSLGPGEEPSCESQRPSPCSIASKPSPRT
ncbi:unnamed protein product [Caretta caretta]